MHALWRGTAIQRLRLASGLILAAFLTTHLANHALGLVSVEVMETLQTHRIRVTRSWPGTIVLISAMLVHLMLALESLVRRREWRMPMWQAAQVATGLAVPLLLMDHLATTRLASSVLGTADFYAPVLVHYWPNGAITQAMLVLVAWTHCCVGLHFWLRLSSLYRRLLPIFFMAATLLPALALAGFMVAGRALEAAHPTAAAKAHLLSGFRWPDAAGRGQLDGYASAGVALFALLLASVTGWHVYRAARARLGRQVTVHYAGVGDVTAPVGLSLLEISRRYRIPHASICGGRARCSTCRVEIEEGASVLPPPRMAEAMTLGAIGAAPGVRLACQIRPQHAIAVRRVVRASGEGWDQSRRRAKEESGIERDLAVMFLDLRGFTALTQNNLPYDTVFLLNRFFRSTGAAIGHEGGWIDKYMGDGLLAVFGRDSDLATGARAALAAARRIDQALDELNGELGVELGRRIDVGIGLHAGPLVVGRIGHPDSATITVIGPTVNIASRLEALSKDHRCQLVVSEALVQAAGWMPRDQTFVEVAVRGVDRPLRVLLIARARTVPELSTPQTRSTGT